MWVFKIKRNKDSNIKKLQTKVSNEILLSKKSFDYDKTYAPVARLKTFRIIISLLNENYLLLNQLDVTHEFLQGEVNFS